MCQHLPTLNINRKDTNKHHGKCLPWGKMHGSEKSFLVKMYTPHFQLEIYTWSWILGNNVYHNMEWGFYGAVHSGTKAIEIFRFFLKPVPSSKPKKKHKKWNEWWKKILFYKFLRYRLLFYYK